MAATPNFIAGGDISTCRIVVKGSADHTVVQATNETTAVIGVSQEGSRRVPKSDDSADDRLAAKSGESLHIFGDGEECLVEADAAVAVGDYLKASADGQATPVLFTETVATHYAGIALEAAAAAGVKFRMLVRPGFWDTV